MNKNTKISIIIPTYNIEKYLEFTLKSIISQDYPNLELVIMDAGSTDGTLQILEKYKQNFSVFISEKDNGQYDAINKGFLHATGDIFAYINGDDTYYPWTFRMVSKIFNENSNIQWIGGIPTTMNHAGIINGFSYNTPARPRKYIQNGWFKDNSFGYLQQEGMFWTRELWEKSGGLDTKYRLAADYDLWIKFSKYSELVSVGIPFACFRIRKDSRSYAFENVYKAEVTEISRDLPRPGIFFSKISKNRSLNLLARKLTFKKSLTFKYYKINQSWRLRSTFDSMSIHPLSSFIQELLSVNSAK